MEQNAKNKTVAFTGAGVMGAATALAVARNGYQVILKDISAEILDQAKKIMKNEYPSACMMNVNFRFAGFREKSSDGNGNYVPDHDGKNIQNYPDYINNIKVQNSCAVTC